MEIRGKNITLRPLSIEDLPVCFRWAQDPEVMHHVTGKTVNTLEEEKKWLENVLTSKEEKVFMILINNDEPIGTCGVHFTSTSPLLRDEEGISLGIMIGEKSQWGKGYGTEAIKCLAEYVHVTYKESRIWLTVDIDNARGIRAYEKAGFKIAREIVDHRNPERKQLLMEIVYPQ